MKLKEILVKEVLLQEFCDYLEENSAIASTQGRLAQLIKQSDDLVFKPFGIEPSDPKYFIAGSARLYLYPELAEILNLKEVGDLDMVIPGEEEWATAQQYIEGEPLDQVKKEVKPEEFSKGIWRPTPDDSIEAFTKWAPQLAKDAAAKSFQVRDSKKILEDSVKKSIGGYYFMSMRDIIDYKLALSRQKEQVIVDLLLQFRTANDDTARKAIKQKLISAFAGDSEEADDFLAPALAAKTTA